MFFVRLSGLFTLVSLFTLLLPTPPPTPLSRHTQVDQVLQLQREGIPPAEREEGPNFLDLGLMVKLIVFVVIFSRDGGALRLTAVVCAAVAAYLHQVGLLERGEENPAAPVRAEQQPPTSMVRL